MSRMRKRLVLVAIAGLACVVAIAYAVSASGGRGALERVVDCVKKAGYTTTVFHDSGLRPASADDPDAALLLGDSNGMIRVREPSDKVTVFGRDATTIAVIRFPVLGARTLRPGPHLRPHDRIILGGCVASA